MQTERSQTRPSGLRPRSSSAKLLNCCRNHLTITAQRALARFDMTAMAKVEVLRAACCIAGADGNVDENELVLLKRLAAGVGVGHASLNAMISRAEVEKDFYKKQFEVLKIDSMATMQALVEVAGADDKLIAEEIEMLRFFAKRLEMDADTFRNVTKPLLAKINKSTS